MIEGLRGTNASPQRVVMRYDVANMVAFPPIPDTHPEHRAASFRLDPTGEVFMRANPEQRIFLQDFPTATVLESYAKDEFGAAVCHVGPGAELRIHFAQDERAFTWGERNNHIWLRGPHQKVLLEAMSTSSLGNAMIFSRDGQLAVWGHQDGTVTVFDPKAVQGRLNGFGLGW